MLFAWDIGVGYGDEGLLIRSVHAIWCGVVDFSILRLDYVFVFVRWIGAGCNALRFFWPECAVGAFFY